MLTVCEAPACVAPACVAPACAAPADATQACEAPACAGPACEAPTAWRALGALGDAVALLDRRTHVLRWASEAWLALHPQLAAGTSRAELERVLPGIGAAFDTPAPCRSTLGAGGFWDARTAVFDGDHLLLRLTDAREPSRVLQRQLDDREQLLFTSRVISVGEMATTLAHELNQPIGATANLLRGLRTRLATRGLNGEEQQALDRAIEQVMFASRVIARIREFTHSHQPRHAGIDLAALVRASASLLDWDLQRSGTRLVLQLPDSGVMVRGDEVMLQQVIVNLIRNALDALRSDPPAAPQVTLVLRAGARDAELQIRDNGCGLGEDAAARLFVPFASTKPNGMGLGLSICRSFVELHQGRLWFSRNADRGATFHLGLPLLAARPST